MDADRTIARIAAAHHSAVARRQLLDAGVARHVVDHRVAKGLLVPTHPGVYRLAGSPPSWHQRIMAATLAAGSGAVASHRAAAFLHGMAVEPRAEVTVGRDRAPTPAGVVVHRLALPRSDSEVRDGIPRTRPPATILGLAAVLSGPALERALDEAVARGVLSYRQLERRLDAVGRQGRPGARALAELLRARSGEPRWTQSEFERRLLALVTGAGLPALVPQLEVPLPNGRRAFIDFAWPDLRVGLEADSYRHHSNRVDWSRHHIRNLLIVSLGWRLLPVTWEYMVERPEELIADLTRARAA
ncbi:MAG TPA: hypothetical protein VHF91_10000 [Acidimicrobiales bacterium]|nr:hypothetical protein [Acidimicrobiales bacterium]